MSRPSLSEPAPRRDGRRPRDPSGTGDPRRPREQPTRVLFLIGSLEPAGPELRLLDFARGFPATVEVHVCVLGTRAPLVDEFRAAGAKVVQIPVRRAPTDWRQVRQVLAYVREHRITVVNSFDLKSLLVAVASKLRFGRRIAAVHHLVSLWDDITPRQARVLRLAMRRVDHLLCNGHAVRAGVLGDRKVRQTVAVIPNGVDAAVFRPSSTVREEQRRRHGFAPDAFVLGTVANFRPVKNYPLLLRAVRRLADRHPRLRLLCVGDGALRSEITAQVERLGLGETVILAGSTRDVRAPLAAMDAFVLCSAKEGNPNVVLQAMAMGLPTAGSAVGEIPYLLDGGAAGVLFPPDDEDALVAAMTRLLDDSASAAVLARAARQRAAAVYSLRQMLDDYVAFFRRVADGLPVHP